MESQQQTSSVILASNVSKLISRQNKIKPPVSKFSINIDHHGYNKQLVWNRFALHTAGRYNFKGLIV